MKHFCLLIWPILYLNIFMGSILKIEVDLQSLDYPPDRIDFIFKEGETVRVETVELNGYVSLVAMDIDESEEAFFESVIIHSQETKKVYKYQRSNVITLTLKNSPNPILSRL